MNMQHRISPDLHIENFKPVYGGDINTSFRLDTNRGTFFIKLNDAALFPGMFEKEAHGLDELRKTATVYVPEVIMTGQVEDTAFLVLEFISPDERKGPAFWEKFGRQLAELHRHTNRYYGFYEDNYNGSLIQINTPDDSWVNFFIEKRLKYQLKIALNKGYFDTDTVENFERLFENLHDIIPDELPHLLHGDLWSGNFLSNPDKGPVLIDPAVYYGNREMDLAMTQLFGGFDDIFYASYHEAYPLHPGWQTRFMIYQLYPLLVHANLFGGSYIHSVTKNLEHILNAVF
jgi:fructosamine-3-kinase